MSIYGILTGRLLLTNWFQAKINLVLLLVLLPPPPEFPLFVSSKQLALFHISKMTDYALPYEIWCFILDGELLKQSKWMYVHLSSWYYLRNKFKNLSFWGFFKCSWSPTILKWSFITYHFLSLKIPRILSCITVIPDW